MAKTRQFEEGIRFYTKGFALVEVFFPEDEVMCQYCLWCRSEGDLDRFWCRLSNEMIYNPFSRYRGERCPLVFEEGEDNV